METMHDKISSLAMEGNIAVAGFMVFNAYGGGAGSAWVACCLNVFRLITFKIPV